MKNTRKQLILEAHKAACSEWKQKIETEFPKLFVKISGWFKDETQDDFLAYYKNNIRQYGINSTGHWFDNCSSHCLDSNDESANDEEVEQALIKEAKKRGFKEGVKYICEGFPVVLINFLELTYYSGSGGYLTDGHGGSIFNDGKWATIIEDKKEMTHEQIEKELGYSIKYKK